MSRGAPSLEGGKEKSWASQAMMWYLMQFYGDKKWGRKYKQKMLERKVIVEREEPDDPWWRSGKFLVWRATENRGRQEKQL